MDIPEPCVNTRETRFRPRKFRDELLRLPQLGKCAKRCRMLRRLKLCSTTRRLDPVHDGHTLRTGTGPRCVPMCRPPTRAGFRATRNGVFDAVRQVTAGASDTGICPTEKVRCVVTAHRGEASKYGFGSLRTSRIESDYGSSSISTRRLHLHLPVGHELPDDVHAGHRGRPRLLSGHRYQVRGVSFSTTWSMVKLAAFARGGNSLKLSSHLATTDCAEIIRKSWSLNHFA